MKLPLHPDPVLFDSLPNILVLKFYHWAQAHRTLTVCNDCVFGNPSAIVDSRDQFVHWCTLTDGHQEVKFLHTIQSAPMNCCRRKQARRMPRTHLCCQSIRELYIVGVGCFQAQSCGDVSWSGRPRLILQTAQIRLDVASIHFDLRLVRELNLLGTCVFPGAKDHDSIGLIINTSV